MRQAIRNRVRCAALRSSHDRLDRPPLDGRGAGGGAPRVRRLLLGLAALTALQVTAVTVDLRDSGSVAGQRWLDVAGQAYRESFRTSYGYGGAGVAVHLDYAAATEVFAGTLTAVGLKPNFAYQIKIEGLADGRLDNERIGLAGRWWEEAWLAGRWYAGTNLNLQPNPDPAYAYPNPNPNDLTYLAHRDVVDGSGHLLYRHTGYLVLGYFVTDAHGHATVPFRLDNSYHVLWTTRQRVRDVVRDGPVVAARLDAATSYLPFAYENAGGTTTIDVFGEWERLPRDAVVLPHGDYEATFVLTEESFHAGSYAKAMAAEIQFRIQPALPPTVRFAALPEEAGLRRPPTVAVVFSAAVTGFTAEDIEVSNGGVAGFSGSGAEYQFVVVPDRLGEVILRVPAEVCVDPSGTPNAASAPVAFRCVPGSEPDDTPAQAAELAAGVLYADSVHHPGNVDWFSFTLPSGPVAYALTLETAGPAGDTQLTLFGPDSSAPPIAADDDGGSGAFSRLERRGSDQALRPGTYYVRVAAPGAACLDAYTLRATWTPYYTVTFAAAPNGTLDGPTRQLVLSGHPSAAVTALPAPAYVFERWSDGVAANPRRVAGVTADLALLALFRPATAVLRPGVYLATVDASAAVGGQGLWNLTGHYETTACGYPLRLDLVHDSRGRISGSGSLALAASFVPLRLQGTFNGTASTAVIGLTARGQGRLLWSALPAAAELRLACALDAVAATLGGPATLRLQAGADSAVLAAPCRLDVPAAMDGSFALRFDLTLAGRAVGGSAELRLANGAAYPLLVRKGRVDGTAVALVLVGAPMRPEARSLKITTTATLLEDGSARLDAAAVQAFGQSLAW